MKNILLSKKPSLLFFLSFVLMFLLTTQMSFGQLTITSLPASYSNNFNSFNPTSLANTTSTLISTGVGSGISNPTASGWTFTNAPGNYNGRGTGTATGGGIYAYGVAGPPANYSLGMLRSGTAPSEVSYTISFTNTSGSTITSLTISWDYQQWRFVNGSGINVTGTGALATNTTLNAKDFTGTSSGTSGTVATTPVTSFTLSGLSIANNASFGMTFITVDAAGSDNGVSIDNFSLSASSAPSPLLTPQTLSSGLSTTYGTASTPGIATTAAGTDLTAATLTATPQANFEVSSTNATSGFQSTAITGLSSGATIWVRLAASAPASTSAYNGVTCVVLSGGGAASVNITTAATGNSVSKKALNITAANQSVAYGTAASVVTSAGSYTATGFVNSENSSVIGGTATYTTTYTNTTPAATAGITVTPVVGSLTATNYSFTPVAGTVTINKANQSITFAATDSKVYGAANYSLAATATSGGAITYTNTNNTTVASISGSTVTILGIGTSVITASQAGDSNYNPASSVDQTLTVIAKGLTISGLTADNKPFDGNTTATLSGIASLSGLVSGDEDPNVVLDGSLATAAFVSSAVGNGIQVNVSGYTISGPKSGNYTLTQPTLSANITATSPIIFSSGTLSATNTTYGSPSATPTSFNLSAQSLTEGVLVTAPAGYEVSTTIGSGYASFITVGAAGNVAETTIYVRLTSTATVSGSPYSGNIVLTSGTATAVNVATVSSAVSPKTLTITGLTGVDKTYDTFTIATVSGTATLNGVVNSDDVSLDGSGASFAFASATAGAAKPITASGYSITGAGISNYTLSQPTGLTATIFKASTTISVAPTASTITYGQTLASSALTLGTANVPGVFTFTTPSTAPNAGTADQGVTFTPTDTVNYNNTTGLASVTVNKANQTISNFPSNDTRALGAANYALGATATNGGAVTYTNTNNLTVASITGSTVTIIGVGTSVITATQAGDSNYNPVTANQTLTVTYPVLAGWDFNTVTSTGVATFAATTFNTNLVSTSSASNITRGSSAALSAGASSFRTQGFQNNGIATSNTDYFQTTLTATAGNLLSLATINANLVGTTSFAASPGVSSQFAYSLNGTTFTLIGSPIVTIGTPNSISVDLTGVTALQNVAAGTTVTFRYYASGQTTTGGWGFNSPSAGTNGLALNGLITKVPPTVTTDAATVTSSTTATLNGTVNANGNATTASFDYGSVVTATTPASGAVTGTSNTATSVNLTGLSVNTQYTYKAVASGGTGGTVNGSDVSFYTHANAPSTPTLTNAGETSIDVAIAGGDGNPGTTLYAIQLNNGSYVQAGGATLGAAVWQTSGDWSTTTISNIGCGFNHTVTVYAKNGDGVITAGTSANLSTTTCSNPTLQADPLAAFNGVCLNASLVKDFALLGLNLTGNVTVNTLTGFTFSTDNSNFFASLTLTPVNGEILETIYVKFTPTAAQSYSIPPISITGGGTSGISVSVTASGINTPATVTTGSATVSSTGAVVAGTATAGCSAITTTGIEYSLNSDFSGSLQTNGAFPVTLSGLSPNTTYYYKAFAIDGSGTVYGSPTNQSFLTSGIGAPTATAASNVTDSSFTANWGSVAGATAYQLDVATNSNFVSNGVVIASEGFNNSMSLFSNVGGNYFNGTGGSPTTNRFSEGTHSFGVSNSSAVLTSTDINTVGSSSQLTFRLGAFGNTTASGLDTNDSVTIEVSPDGGTTWYTQVQVTGNSQASWGVVGTGTGALTASAAYDTDNIFTPFAPGSASGLHAADGYSTVTVTGLPSVSNLKVRISLVNNVSSEWWIVDDFKIIGNTNYILPSYDGLAVTAVNGNFQSQAVTGLTSNTTYHYRVRAVSTNSTSTNSNFITVTTCASAPVITGYTPGSTVSGTSAHNGAVIRVYNGVTEIGTATVSGGAWSATVSPAIAASDVLTATAQVGTECVSVASSSVTVPFPTFASIIQYPSQCSGLPNTFEVTGLLSNTLHTIYYTINGAAQTPIDLPNTLVGTVATFNLVLTDVNDGQILRVTSIEVTGAPSSNVTIPLSGSSAITLDVNLKVTPTFAPVAPICTGGTVSALPTTSLNGIPGTWSLQSTTSSAITYAFQPNLGVCANPTTLVVDVYPVPVSGTLTKSPATASVCVGATVSATATAGSGGIGTITDELEVSLNGGAYAAYVSATPINTTGLTTVSIRTRRTATGSGCTTSAYTIVSWTVNALPVVSTPSSTVCVGNTIALSPSSGGTWTSSDATKATVDANTGVVTGIAPGSATFTFTNTTTGCSNTTSAVTVGPQPSWYLDADGDGYYTGPAVVQCDSPGAGYTTTVIGGGDCADVPVLVGNPTNVLPQNIRPNAVEICYNNIDDDCDGLKSEGCSAVVVNMTPATVITNFAIALSAVPYTYVGAVTLGYRFWIKNMTSGQIREVDLASRFVTIPSDIRSYNTIYQLKVAAIINGEYLTDLDGNTIYAGNTISVISPSVQLVKLSSASCNSTLSYIGSTISSTAGPNALSYTFRIRLASDNPTLPATPTYYTVTTTGSRFVGSNSFVGLSLQYGTDYLVSVKYTFNNNDGLGIQEAPYGDECLLTTPGIPVIRMSNPTCGTGIPLASISSTISSASATYALQYRFRRRLASDISPTPVYSTSLPLNSRYTSLVAINLGGHPLSYDTVYMVSVEYSLVNNSQTVWSGYGPECEIKTPEAPTTELVPAQCGTPVFEGEDIVDVLPYSVPSMTEKIYATAVTTGASYRYLLQQFDVNSDPTIYNEEITRTQNWFTLSMFVGPGFQALTPGAEYKVTVVTVSPYGDGYGKDCTIQAPGSLTKTVTAVAFKAKAYPNPFANNFLVDLTTESKSAVSLKVYDMVGRLVDQQVLQVTDLKTSPIGDSYPSGVYNMVLTQGDEVQTLRVVKR